MAKTNFDEYIEMSRKLAHANAAAEKKVTVLLASAQLRELKNNDYRLCFAKKVGTSDFNVVWQSSHKFMNENEFSWVPLFQVFGTNTFRDSIVVKTSATPVSIGLGQKVTLDKYGAFGNVTSDSECDPNAITFINDYDSIHPGVNQMVGGIDGSLESKPIYVATKAAISGAKVVLTPVEKILVWFEQDIQTSTMFSNARSKSFEIDLTNTNSSTVKFDGGKWYTE